MADETDFIILTRGDTQWRPLPDVLDDWENGLREIEADDVLPETPGPVKTVNDRTMPVDWP